MASLEVELIWTGVDDESAEILANGLINNCKLKRLRLVGHAITAEGWKCFSKVLCDTTSVNKTYLSNHTLHVIDEGASTGGKAMPNDLISVLKLNRRLPDEKLVAFLKIVQSHCDFNMQPLFTAVDNQAPFKILPNVIHWFEAAFIYIIKLEDFGCNS